MPAMLTTPTADGDGEPPDIPPLLVCQNLLERPRLRLLLFPHAGGSVGSYAGWHNKFASQHLVEVWAVQPPGRGARAREPAFTSMAQLVEAVLRAIVQGDLHLTPLVLFGHSFGSLVAYEVCAAMIGASLPSPICLIVSAHAPPTRAVPQDQARLSTLADADLWRALVVWDFAPPEMAAATTAEAEAELASLAPLLSPVRTDLCIRESYLDAAAPPQPKPLPLPVIPVGGSQDCSVDPLALAGWRGLGTGAAAATEMLPGGHFYLHSKHGGPSTDALLSLITQHALAALSAIPPSVAMGAPVAAMLSPGADGTEGNELYVHEMFLKAAELTPDAVAVMHEGGQLSYAELRAEVMATAGWLVSVGAKPKGVVAVLLEHRYESLVAQLAVGVSGAAFFPLETHLGPKALADILTPAAPVALITSRKHASRLPTNSAPTLNFDDPDWRRTVSEGADRAPAMWGRAAAYDPGIITMTSGTTGAPKTVLNPMISYTVAVVAREHRYPYTGTHEREATNVMFSWEAARPVAYGCVAVIIPDELTIQPAELRALLDRSRSTRILTTPSLLAAFLELGLGEPKPGAPPALEHMRTWLLCGEVAPAALVQRMARTLPHVRLINDYSSWEGGDTAYATLLPARPPRPFEPSHRIAPAGEPTPGVSLALLDSETMTPVPRGCLGEMFVISPQAFTGYAHAPELTAARLLPVPHALLPLLGLSTDSADLRLLKAHAAEARRQANADGGALAGQDDPDRIYMYRTGDLARLIPGADGPLAPWQACQVLGRMDSTVKIRGFKVGLAWVEATIGSVAGVARCAVATLDDPVTRQPIGLVAHVFPTADAAATAFADEPRWLSSLRDAARAELPLHALPRHWMLTHELGTLSAGESKKLDRKRLPKPTAPGVGAPVGAPAAPAAPAPVVLRPAGGAAALEASMLPLWAEILSVSSVSPNDNFFDLGGHSLLGAKLVAAITARLGVRCTVLDLFEAPTPSELARVLCAHDAPGPAKAPAAAPPPPPRELALIGMEGRFPKAPDTEAYWRLLLSGGDALTLWTRAELAAQNVPPEVYKHPRFVPAAYMVEGAEFFDAAFWALSPHESSLMDPQHRLFLEVAWATFEAAGIAPRSGTPRRTAVVAAAGIDGYMHHHLDGLPLKDALSPGDIFLGEVGSEKDYIATRVSYALDLMGPSLSVNSACSSGLLAVAQAAQTILTGQADLALGGASALSFPSHGYLFEDGLVASIDGRVRPFDAAAHGTVFGDAVGAVLLKPLAAALADGDTVLASVLGFGIANDGSRKAGYAAPGVAGQRATIGAAFAHAGVGAASLSYVECHATGTLVGDGIETRSLTDAFAEAGAGAAEVAARGAFCAIGSVKGNIGHANAAAGITGLIKATLCLTRQMLVPTAHFVKLNKNVLLDGTPLQVFQGPAAPWIAPLGPNGGAAPRRCGISSFGIGGTNVHMILQAADTAEPPAAPAAAVAAARPVHMLCVSGRTRAAAGRAAAQLSAALREQREEEANGGAKAPPLYSVAAQLLSGREAFPHRIAIAASSRDGAIAALAAAARSAVQPPLLRRSPSSSSICSSISSSPSNADPLAPHFVPKPRGAPPVVFIFPGQGSQCPRMGEGLYRSEPAYRRHLDRICDLFTPELGFDLRGRLFPPAGAEDARAQLDAPTLAQPAIFATELALGLTLIEDYGVTPAALAGHSIGEFVAATLAGVWSEADAVKLISLRARLSEDARPGGMLAAQTSADRVSRLTAMPAFAGRVFMAVENTAGRQVLAGEEAALLSVAALLQDEGIKSRKLPMPRAYHTPLMSSVSEGLATALSGIQLAPPRLQFACNGTGGWMEPATATDPAYWAAHVSSPVKWTDNMDLIAGLAAGGGALVLELGSGGSLAPLLAECQADGAAELTLLPTLRQPRLAAADGTPDALAFTTALCALWEADVPLRLAPADARYTRVRLPTHPFEQAVHWLNPLRSMYVRQPAEAAEQAAVETAAARVDPASQPQLVRLKRATEGRRWVSAYCLAYAGGSTQAFAELAAAAPEWMEVVAIETPGKGVLADAAWPAEGAAPGAPAAEAEAAMMADLAARVGLDAAGTALVLVGWSMGGMLATEMALHLQAAGSPPQLLHIAGRMAPGSFVTATETDLDSYNLVDEELRQTDAYREWLLPMLLADLRADARAEARVAAGLLTAAPLRCALQVCCGDVDPAFPPPAASAWLGLTEGKQSVHTLQGGHEVLQQRTIELLALIVEQLLPQSPLYAVQWSPLDAPATARPSADDDDDEDEATAGAETAALVAGARLLLLGALPYVVGPREARAARSVGGLLVYLVPQPDLASQQAQCSALLSLAVDVASAGGGRMVLLCSADTDSSLAAGASKVVPLEYPELRVQRLFLDPAADLLCAGGSARLASVPSVRAGWVAWLAAAASRALSETDLHLRSSDLPPLAPRLLALPPPAPATDVAIDPTATYLITGGSGGLGGALVDWLLDAQGVHPANVVLLSRRGLPHPRGVVSLSADLSDAASLAECEPLLAVAEALDSRPLGGIFHLAGVLDDGLIINMTLDRLSAVTAPKAGILPLLAWCADQQVTPRWLLLASSTSSLLGYAGQANYCAANALLDHAATFGLPASAGAEPPRVVTLNFGPWGEVGMAKEGTKAHALSLASGETPMASAAAIGCVAHALRALQSDTVSPNLQFCVADVEWWRSPWPDHPLLQGVLRRTPPAPASTQSLSPAAPTVAPNAVAPAKGGSSTNGRAQAESWMRGRLSEWDGPAMLASLGLDSLDLVQLRNAFNKHFQAEVPLSIFSNASQTLDELIDRVGTLL
jgi:acyl transferase domain-containing protein/non-ribosomal peptide synthetase component F/acyl carrier protein